MYVNIIKINCIIFIINPNSIIKHLLLTKRFHSLIMGQTIPWKYSVVSDLVFSKSN